MSAGVQVNSIGATALLVPLFDGGGYSEVGGWDVLAMGECRRRIPPVNIVAVFCYLLRCLLAAVGTILFRVHLVL